ncbi:MAG: glycerol-3-phosphate dehydrogenase (NAD(P)+), partial [Maribacter sp.]
MKNEKTFAVLGGGSWATAIVKMLTGNGRKVGWYMRNTDAINHIKTQRHNPNYLSSVEFPVSLLDLSSDINKTISTYDVLIFAIPSAFLNTELEKLTASFADKIIFSAIKGIVPETGLIVGEHFHRTYDVPFKSIGV